MTFLSMSLNQCTLKNKPNIELAAPTMYLDLEKFYILTQIMCVSADVDKLYKIRKICDMSKVLRMSFILPTRMY